MIVLVLTIVMSIAAIGLSLLSFGYSERAERRLDRRPIPGWLRWLP